VFTDPLVAKLAEFVWSIGIDVQACKIDWKTQFPGLEVQAGKVLVDESQLLHPGNILHEAGHIAVHDPLKREHKKFSPGRGEELGALAWSYAAVRHLGLDSELVFYPESFHGWSTALVENFAEGRYLGIPMLQRYGMALDALKAAECGVDPYPHMLKWLR
jgi:hypothetical protein